MSKGDKMDLWWSLVCNKFLCRAVSNNQHGTQCAVARPIEGSKGPVQGSTRGPVQGSTRGPDAG